MRKDIQWYPGHMAKAKRMLQENMKLVDVVIELLDARIPMSSRNPDVDNLLSSKPRIVVLNKADMAEEDATKAWAATLRYGTTQVVIPVDSVKGIGINQVVDEARKAAIPRLQVEASKGRRPRPVRVMVVGIPNVGKSSIINRMVTKASTRVGNKPGVTRGPQWVRIRDDVELLDTPGMLWPKFEDQQVGVRLALTGAISPEVLDTEEMVENALVILAHRYPSALTQRYPKCPSLDDLVEIPPDILLKHRSREDTEEDIDSKDKHILSATAHKILESIALSRGFLLPGGSLDLGKASNALLQDLRDGRLGRITLDLPRFK